MKLNEVAYSNPKFWVIFTGWLLGDCTLNVNDSIVYAIGTHRGELAPQMLVGFFFKGPQKKRRAIGGSKQQCKKGHDANCLRGLVGFFPPRYMASPPLGTHICIWWYDYFCLWNLEVVDRYFLEKWSFKNVQNHVILLWSSMVWYGKLFVHLSWILLNNV
jgi:hypothetical protein